MPARLKFHVCIRKWRENMQQTADHRQQRLATVQARLKKKEGRALLYRLREETISQVAGEPIEQQDQQAVR